MTDCVVCGGSAHDLMVERYGACSPSCGEIAELREEVRRLRVELEKSSRQVERYARRIDDLKSANIELQNKTAIRVAAPPSTLARLHAEVERLRAAIQAHRERLTADSLHDLADRDLWEVLDA